MLVGLSSLTCLGFGSALVMAGSNARTSQIAVRGVAVHDAARRAAAATITVCSSDADYSTIQEAVDHAADGDTITVCDGTYPEQVTIPVGKDGLTLSAESKGAVIKAPTTGWTGGQQGAIVKVEAQRVTIERFTISGPGSGSGSIGYGVEVVTGGSATVDSNDIVHIRDEPLSGDQNGWAIGATGGSVTATSNLIEDFQKDGIMLTGASSVDMITDNTIVGAGPTSKIAQNGITISGGASATVSENDVSKIFYSPNTATATGIIASKSPGDVVIENNTVSDAQAGIYLISGPSAITVRGNTIHGGNYGIVVQAASAVRVVGNTTHDQANNGLLATDDAKGKHVRRELRERCHR
jgi:parallel beta-helix repeat protein